jgi:hypothetical protein
MELLMKLGVPLRGAPMGVTLGILILATALPARAGDVGRDGRADALVKSALGTAAAGAPAPGRELFQQVLASEAFESGTVGPFDVHVRVADGLKHDKDARKTCDQVLAGLKPAADFLEQHFNRADGLVSGHRFTLVFAQSEPGSDQQSFAEILALLDRCEDGGYSGWKPDLPVDNVPNQAAAVVNTWEVLVFNLAHPEAKANLKGWLEHGVGYRTLNLITNLLLQVGAFGPMPPWLQQGLSDELDIAAYGTAWVAAGESTSWVSQTSGWTLRGWEGFLPEGAVPPPSVYEPPKDLGTTYTKHVEGDGWIARGDSPTRHWSKLAADVNGKMPPSLQRAATLRDYVPRDRAWARLVMHLAIARPESNLLEVLDHRPEPTRGGLRGGEPLTVVVARALGGTPALDVLEKQSLREQLESTERAATVKRIEDLGGGELLGLADHRQQSEWLYYQPECPPTTRQVLFNLIVEAEYAQQLREWEVVGAALDRAAIAAIKANKSFPAEPEQLQTAAELFAETFAKGDPTPRK